MHSVEATATTRVVACTQLLARHLRRRVLRSGVLRPRWVRAGVVVLTVLVLGVSLALAIRMFDDARISAHDWRYLFALSSSSAIIWAQAAHLLVRVLFINATALVDVSRQLPMTNRERGATFLLFELGMVVIVCSAGFAVFGIASIVVLGTGALQPIAVWIVLPILLAYLLLQSFVTVAMRALARLPIDRAQHAVVLSLLGAGLAAMVLWTGELVTRGDPDAAAPFAVLLAALPGGDATALAVGAPVAAALAAFIVCAAPPLRPTTSRYVRVPLGPLTRWRGAPYAAQILRSNHMQLAVMLATIVFGVLLVKPLMHPCVAISVLAMPGLYAYAATRTLHTLQGVRRSPVDILLSMLLPQAFVVVVASVVGCGALAIWRPALLVEGWVFSVAALVGVVLATSIGVAFPAHDDNPFSVLIGGLVACLSIAALAIAFGLLRVPAAALPALVTVSTALLIVGTLAGIRIIDRRTRHG